ncbi:hypothetical protein F511_16912 [Dorcoceras hygrometricum]|uniref:Uncharacterized protein n=1 Tax=Dorcoceras hygrometricum TaxID=472368 RepID=A0A2Z7AHZ9_9LAMI|nr:hypothetical protein F511_16912 [Dorcoceras hygrometricum]
MASSLISSSHHIDFDSVFGMEEAGMVQMFESLIATGLKNFMGCHAVFSEPALTEFFANGSVRDGLVVSTMGGTSVEISENIFTATFELPSEGLTDLSKVPKNLVFDARSIFSISNEQMVTPGSRQAKGFAIQICAILKNVSGLALGEFQAFPASRVLTEKTIHRYVVLNDKVGGEADTDAPRAKKTPVNKAMSQKRPASDAEVAPVVKKKRTTKAKPAAVALEARKMRLVPDTDDEIHVEAPPAVEGVDTTIGQPAAEAATDLQEPVVEDVHEPVVGGTTAVQPAAEVGGEAIDERVDEPVPEQPVEVVAADVQKPGVEIERAEAAAVSVTVETIVETVVEPVEAHPVVEPAVEVTTEDPDTIIEQVLDQLDSVDANQDDGDQPAATTRESIPWFDLPLVLATCESEGLFETASDTDNEMDFDMGNQTLPEVREADVVIGTDADIATVDVEADVGDQQLQLFNADDSRADAVVDSFVEDWKKHDARGCTVSVDVPLPSAGMEITKIKMGTEIKIPGVDERTWYLASLPNIPVDDRGKKPIVQKDPIKGRPHKEHYSLICADIDLLVKLRAQVIDDIAQFFNSFSLKKLETINIEEMAKKEEQFLSWGETESTHVALQWKLYILLKYREILVKKFLDSWKQNFVPGEGFSATDLKVRHAFRSSSVVLEELKKEAQPHGLTWKKTCCSQIFYGSPHDRGAVIARNNTTTPSKCWIRRMIRVDGVWVVETCYDRWVKIPRAVVSNEVPRQCSYVDFMPVLDEDLKLLRKIWANIYIEAANFFVSGRLVPVGSINFCKSLSVVDSVYSVAPCQSTILALRISQFCTVFIHYSLFSRLPTADITSFISSVAMERIVLRSVQIAQTAVSVAPRVQLIHEHSSSESTSDDTSMDFADQDTATTDLSLPSAATPYVTEALAQLGDPIDQIRERDDGAKLKDTLLMHLHDIERKFSARFDEQDRALTELRKDSQDQRNLLSLDIRSSQKQLGSQIAATALDTVDVRREVKAMHARVDVVATGVDNVRKYVEATKEAISHQLLEFQSQAQANYIILTDQLGQLVDYINRGGNDKKGEGSSRGPQPPPVVQIRDRGITDGSDDVVRTADISQTDIDNAQRDIMERLMREDRERERERRERSRMRRSKWVCLVTLAMSVFDLHDVCIAIGSLATLDLPMVVDLIGIYVLKGPYCTLTTTNWFLQALSVIPRGSWGDVARRFTMIRWATAPSAAEPPLAGDRTCSDQFFEVIPSVANPSSLLVQIYGGRLNPVVDLIGGSTAVYRQEPDFPCEIWLEPGA